MEKQIITFSANEQRLIKTGGIECYASYIVSYIEAHFDLGANWSGYDSVRAVWSNDNNMTVISTVLDSNGVCIVPFEVLKTKGIVKVNLVGSISVSDVLTDRLTSFPCEAVKVTAKAKIEGSETQPITPSQFEQFVAAVISEVEKVTGMTAQAETLPAGSQATARYENGILYLGIPQGIQGERGETGADGNGIASVVYNADYSLTLVFDNGERFTTPPIRGERGPAGADGRDGTDGRDGADGVTPSLSVGTVTTLPSTEDAYVTRTGTDENPVFNFGIPQGPKGDTGEVTMSQLDEATIVQTLSDNEPYHFRATPKCGSRQLDTIVGGSVGWNQLVPALENAKWSSTGSTDLSASDGVLSFVATARYGGAACISEYKLSGALNHIYYTFVSAKRDSNGDIRARTFGGYGDIEISATSSWQSKSKIFKLTEAQQNTSIFFQDKAVSDWAKCYFKDYMLIDLTQLLGSTIADYVYSLEQSTAGSGVAWLKRYFDLDSYHPFDSGSIQSVSGLVSHDCVGFNQWDEEWEVGEISSSTGEDAPNNNIWRSKDYIRILPDTAYYVCSPTANYVYIRARFYDADKNYIGYGDKSGGQVQINRTFTTPINAYYMRFAPNNSEIPNHDICINISSDRNGQYEPYVKQSYPLDSTLTLRGIPKLADGKMYYDGDVYESDGTVTRKYGIVDLGTLTWTYQTTGWGAHPTFVARYDGINVPNGTVANLICTKYTTVSANTLYAGGDKSIADNGDYVRIRDTAFTDAQTFKTAMSGVYLVYELATPTSETATPYTNPQLSYDGGTEEYVSDCIVPIGHETKYPMTFSDTMPNADGTYTMSVTITNGKPVISWTSSRSLSMGLTKSATAEAEAETEPSKTEEAEAETEEVKTETDKTETR